MRRLFASTMVILFTGCLPGGSDAGSGGSSGGGTYVGQAMCQGLLDAYVSQTGNSYSCPASLTASPDTFEVPAPTPMPCLRDTYVNAAITYCWAAECYAKLGVDQTDVDEGTASMTPEDAAAAAQGELENADALCSDATPVGPGQTCGTLEIHECK